MSKNFKEEEFACKCRCKTNKIKPELIDYLQEFRDELGLPITISSGYRCPGHNTAVGGVMNSSHTFGIAADLQCSDLDRLAKIIEDKYPRFSLGRYDSFLHFDIREDDRSWDKRNETEVEYLPEVDSDSVIEAKLEEIEKNI